MDMKSGSTWMCLLTDSIINTHLNEPGKNVRNVSIKFLYKHANIIVSFKTTLSTHVFCEIS